MFLTLITAAATAVPVAAAPAPDLCHAMLPPALVVQLTLAHGDYQLPRLADLPIDVIRRNAELGGWPCPLVAIADFDGDHRWDRALFLKHKSEPTVRLIAALNTEKDGWQIGLQRDWPVPIDVVHIQPLEAGLYEQTQSESTKAAANTAARLDELNSIQSDYSGFVAGQAQGPRAAFFFQNASWQFIWIAD
ncbi:MAG: hypothetical protein H7Y02_02295 [Candidatus Obscuribacterales bacterium]|nr:hypothetical protein [Steroidobacteraceae bacterium]